MKFTLQDTSYDWQFIPIAGGLSRILAPVLCTAHQETSHQSSTLASIKR